MVHSLSDKFDVDIHDYEDLHVDVLIRLRDRHQSDIIFRETFSGLSLGDVVLLVAKIVDALSSGEQIADGTIDW